MVSNLGWVQLGGYSDELAWVYSHSYSQSAGLLGADWCWLLARLCVSEKAQAFSHAVEL